MTKLIATLVAALFLATSAAWAVPGKDSPTDHNNGGGNDPPAGRGLNNGNSGPGNSWLDDGSFLIAGDNVAPGSGNWGGGPGNSGPGDKNGANSKSKDGGQTPNDDK